MLALRALSKAFGGIQAVARQTDVNAHTLYRTLSEKGNPELNTLSAILKAMGLRLAIQPLSQHALAGVG
ncbi:MAG: hypothetical protein KBD60_04495 [Sterolibacterium sp.]|jgi:probable addiction module antidote protein|nr:hypothetical protein [Sterolibacterium sp.]